MCAHENWNFTTRFNSSKSIKRRLWVFPESGFKTSTRVRCWTWTAWKIETTPVREYCNRQYSTSTSHLDTNTAHGTRFQILRPISDFDTNTAHEIRLPILRPISHLDINTAHDTRYQIHKTISQLDTNTAHETSFQIQRSISHLDINTAHETCFQIQQMSKHEIDHWMWNAVCRI